ncbi:hypothetical protein PENTCL1PPCAC_30616, partial [Pristionchus entomophagus]
PYHRHSPHLNMLPLPSLRFLHHGQQQGLPSPLHHLQLCSSHYSYHHNRQLSSPPHILRPQRFLLS